jgi:hypothetical protein
MRQAITYTADTRLPDDLQDADVTLDSCSLIFDQGSRYNNMRNVVIRRINTPGPAVIRRTTRDVSNTRFSWDHVCVESTGDGVIFEGVFNGRVSGLFVRQCGGDCIIVREATVANANKAGMNAVGIFGGEAQSGNVGIRAANCHTVTFHDFSVQGNRDWGVVAERENEALNFIGGHYENNRKDTTGREFSDIYVRGDSQLVNVFGARFSDGKDQHAGAILNDSDSLVNASGNYFWAYGKTTPVEGANLKGDNRHYGPANTGSQLRKQF